MQGSIQAILFKGQVGRERFLLVAYADGSWAIHCNGQPLEGYCWAEEDLELAIDAFRQMTSMAMAAAR